MKLKRPLFRDSTNWQRGVRWLGYVEDSGIDFKYTDRKALADSVDLAIKRASNVSDITDGIKRAYMNNLVRAMSEFSSIIPSCDDRLTDLSFVFETVACLVSGNNYSKERKLIIKAVKGNGKAADSVANLIDNKTISGEWREWAMANNFRYNKGNDDVAQDETANNLVVIDGKTSQSSDSLNAGTGRDEEIIKALQYNNEVSNKMLSAAEAMVKTQEARTEKPTDIVVVDSKDESSSGGNTSGGKVKRILIFLIIFAVFDVIYTNNFINKQFKNEGRNEYEIQGLNSKEIKKKEKPDAVRAELNSSVTGIVQYKNERFTVIVPVAKGCSIPVKIIASGMPEKVKWWITDGEGNVVKNGVCTGKSFDMFTANETDTYKVHVTGARGSELNLSIGEKMTGFDKTMFYINRPLFALYQKAL